MFKKLMAVSAAVLLSAGASNASVVFHDDFSSYGSTTQLNAPSSFFGTNWSVTGGGTVDYLAHGSSFSDLCIGGGNCIDLDGSTGSAGLFSSQVFAAGSYVLDLGLFGSGRGTTESVTVSLGSWSTTIGPIGSTDNASGTWSFTTTGGALSFQNSQDGDNIGAILTDVTLSTIPVPAGLPLLAGGLGLMGVFGLRRKAKRS